MRPTMLQLGNHVVPWQNCVFSSHQCGVVSGEHYHCEISFVEHALKRFDVGLAELKGLVPNLYRPTGLSECPFYSALQFDAARRTTR